MHRLSSRVAFGAVGVAALLLIGQAWRSGHGSRPTGRVSATRVPPDVAKGRATLRGARRPAGTPADQTLSHRAARAEASAVSIPVGTLLERIAQARALRDAVVLRAVAREDPDARVRVAALESLARLLGPAARDFLVEVSTDATEVPWVHEEAVRILALTGASVAPSLEGLLGVAHPRAHRAGAVRGLATLGTAEGAWLVLAQGDDPGLRLRQTVVQTILEMRAPEQRGVLRMAVELGSMPVDARAAACRALGRSRDDAGVDPLCRTLLDPCAPREVRRAAADALGLLGNPRALGALETAARDSALVDSEATGGLTLALQRVRAAAAPR